jgi:hypothetical protein
VRSVCGALWTQSPWSGADAVEYVQCGWRGAATPGDAWCLPLPAVCLCRVSASAGCLPLPGVCLATPGVCLCLVSAWRLQADARHGDAWRLKSLLILASQAMPGVSRAPRARMASQEGCCSEGGEARHAGGAQGRRGGRRVYGRR